MITKQQALEFIYDISNSFSINMDLTKGIDCFLNVYSDNYGTFRVEGDFNSLEEAITEFIKRFSNTALLNDLKCLIPVDIDMLKVGQTYRVVYSNYWDELEEFTSKLIGIDYDRHTNYKLFEFSNSSVINQGHIEEAYRSDYVD